MLCHQGAALPLLQSSSTFLGAVRVLKLYTPVGTNEQSIIDVLTRRSSTQQKQIVKSFKAQLGKVQGTLMG